ncbi:MAG: pyridoxamine 5'-phosphate oxidase [Panacagrimonas sp.]
MQYTKNPPLNEHELLPDPMAQFDLWLGAARAAGMIEPTAMNLATVGLDGTPAARIVLFKGFFENGISFYTSYDGRKGLEIAANPNVAATFWWDRLERQVRIEGRAERVPREVTLRYFESRPRESRLGAMISRQSQIVATREELDERLAVSEQRFRDEEIPCPENWGGYVIRPERVEFWQGRIGRLHDRLRYRRGDAGWVIERLEP